MPSGWLDPRTALHTLRTLGEAGLIRPVRPDKLLEMGLLLARWGFTPAAGYAVSAARFGDEPAVVDEDGTLSFAQVNDRASALAAALAEQGVRAGDGVGLLCRNSRYFVDATVALAQIGATTLFLNTSFAGPQLAEVLRREGARALVHDAEFAALVAGAPVEVRLDEAGIDEATVAYAGAFVEAPDQPGRMVILTSGTTGTPKGAPRAAPASIDPAVALLSRIPLRARETTVVAAPLFHAWGFAHFSLGMLLSSTLVLRRRFDALATLHDVERTGAEAMAAVPVMLQRMLDVADSAPGELPDTSTLRVVAASGSALPGALATRFMDRFGDVLYNLYGSTEVAWATIATPEDLRAAPGTAGRPPRGTVLRLLDDEGRDVADGAPGRIFVGNDMLFEGYTGGGDKERRDGLMATGDVGRLTPDGLLFVEGRDDDMIVSGGENVFPREVEDLLATHPDVAEAAVTGVPDEQFGQRLAAYVVLRAGRKVDADELRALVKKTLANYKVPRDIVFVDELPRNATGKVVVRELPTARLS